MAQLWLDHILSSGDDHIWVRSGPQPLQVNECTWLLVKGLTLE